MTKRTAFYRKLSLFSYLGLLVWMPVWHLWLANPVGRSAHFEWVLAALWTVPLLLPIRGMLSGKPYTHAWANFIVMFYFIHSLTTLYAVDGERWYALVELLLSTGMFIGCALYARNRGKELGLGIIKLKQEMAEEKARYNQK